jgi:hypothetical protein
MGGQGGAATRRGHIDGRSLRTSPRRGGSCDPPATLAPARHAAEDRRFQLFVPLVLLRITCLLSNDLIIKRMPMGIALRERKSQVRKTVSLVSLARLDHFGIMAR